MPGTEQEDVAPTSARPKPGFSAQERLARDYPGTAFWLAAGLQTRAAIALAGARILTLADLDGKTQTELGAIPGLGRRSIRALERLLGRPIPMRHLEPGVTFWRAKGFMTPAATALCQAGIRSLDDLARTDRETLESLHRVAGGELRRCEELLGRPVPAKRDYWIEKGLPQRVARILITAGIESLDDLGRLTREEFLRRPGLAETTLEQCEELLGRRLPSPQKDWWLRGYRRRYLARRLTQAGILTPEDLRRRNDEELRQAGLNDGDVAFCRRRENAKRKGRGRKTSTSGGA